jgi:flagellar motor switch/type III secretory pathway protein FliN
MDGIPHAFFLGMENTVHAPQGLPDAVAVTDAPLTQTPMLPAPAKEADAQLSEAECTEIVPSLQQQLSSGEESAIPGTLALPEHLRQIPFRLELRVPLSRFTVRDLQQLKAGALLATEHLSVRDLVLTAAGERLLLVELEAIEQQLAARVKRLAWRHKWRRKA